MQNEHLSSIGRETFQSVNVRLLAAKEVQARARFTLIVISIISSMMFTVTFNAYWSYDSNWLDSANNAIIKGKLINIDAQKK